MGVGSIPVSKVWDYMDRFGLPDWWEPILLQADASIVSSANKESSDGKESASKHKGPAIKSANNNVGGIGRSTVRTE